MAPIGLRRWLLLIFCFLTCSIMLTWEGNTNIYRKFRSTMLPSKCICNTNLCNQAFERYIIQPKHVTANTLFDYTPLNTKYVYVYVCIYIYKQNRLFICKSFNFSKFFRSVWYNFLSRAFRSKPSTSRAFDKKLLGVWLSIKKTLLSHYTISQY